MTKTPRQIIIEGLIKRIKDLEQTIRVKEFYTELQKFWLDYSTKPQFQGSIGSWGIYSYTRAQLWRMFKKFLKNNYPGKVIYFLINAVNKLFTNCMPKFLRNLMRNCSLCIEIINQIFGDEPIDDIPTWMKRAQYNLDGQKIIDRILEAEAKKENPIFKPTTTPDNIIDVTDTNIEINLKNDQNGIDDHNNDDYDYIDLDLDNINNADNK